MNLGRIELRGIDLLDLSGDFGTYDGFHVLRQAVLIKGK